MLEFRITKYDPSLRDISGAFLGDEWTAFSDIGKSFSGSTLSEEQHLVVEDAYAGVAVAFLQEAKVASLFAIGVENPAHSVDAPHEGSLVPIDQVGNVLRGLLRENYWCRLEGGSSFIHVGYDYYMYVGVPTKCSEAIAHAQNLGLFVEECSSPYAHDAA